MCVERPSSLAAGPARLTSTTGTLAGKVRLINRAVGSRVQAVVGRLLLAKFILVECFFRSLCQAIRHKYSDTFRKQRGEKIHPSATHHHLKRGRDMSHTHKKENSNESPKTRPTTLSVSVGFTGNNPIIEAIIQPFALSEISIHPSAKAIRNRSKYTLKVEPGFSNSAFASAMSSA